MEELCEYWNNLKGKKFTKVTKEDLAAANRAANRIIEACDMEGIGIISYFEPSFPSVLKTCVNEEGKLDPPIVLYYRGDLHALDRPGVAVIGTREPTKNGENAGLFFASEFAQKGYNIVSGLAIGCDTTGHQGALSVGGVTTAFLANSLKWDDIYPKENQELAKEIVDNGGLLLSEYHMGQNCGKYAFIARDRLQAGLSHATIVIQTGVSGGTMHAVNATLKAGKPLLAVKYNLPDDYCHDKVQGNVRMINDGRAYPLSRKTMEECMELVEESIRKANLQNLQTTLF
jgi:DNA processing protein